MKTLILSFLFIIGLAAPNIGKPINDIYSIKEPILTDEAYVNDIPFDTYEIAVGAILDGDELKLEEESYVNDIPFDTHAIANKYLLQKMVETSHEININDIPFNTEQIFYEKLSAQLTEQYRNEAGIYDLPYEPDYYICSRDISVPFIVTGKVKITGKEADKQIKSENTDCIIISPVKLDLPGIEISNKAGDDEVLIIPAPSL